VVVPNTQVKELLYDLQSRKVKVTKSNERRKIVKGHEGNKALKAQLGLQCCEA